MDLPASIPKTRKSLVCDSAMSEQTLPRALSAFIRTYDIGVVTFFERRVQAPGSPLQQNVHT
jgi:hypothetical protein